MDQRIQVDRGTTLLFPTPTTTGTTTPTRIATITGATTSSTST